MRPEALAIPDLPNVVGTALDAHAQTGPGRTRALVGVLPAAPLVRTLARQQDGLDRRLRRLEAAAGPAAPAPALPGDPLRERHPGGRSGDHQP